MGTFLIQTMFRHRNNYDKLSESNDTQTSSPEESIAEDKTLNFKL